MPEVSVTLPIPDSPYKIYGKYREVKGAPVVVMLHGFTESMDGPLRFMFARILEQAGYSNFRFSFYGYEDDQRSFIDTTAQEYADDLKYVIEYLKSKTNDSQLIVLSHSLGVFPLLIHGPRDIDAVVLWDPSNESWTTGKAPVSRTWINQLNAYRVKSGVDVLVGKALLDHLQTLQPYEMIKHFHQPKYIAAAGDGILLDSCHKYYEHSTGDKLLEIIPNADHGFTEGDSAELLFSKTLSWLQKVVPSPVWQCDFTTPDSGFLFRALPHDARNNKRNGAMLDDFLTHWREQEMPCHCSHSVDSLNPWV